jgi:hypothetical protein
VIGVPILAQRSDAQPFDWLAALATLFQDQRIEVLLISHSPERQTEYSNEEKKQMKVIV